MVIPISIHFLNDEFSPFEMEQCIFDNNMTFQDVIICNNWTQYIINKHLDNDCGKYDRKVSSISKGRVFVEYIEI